MPSALLFTFHDWRTRRLGAFHKIAEALCGQGFEVGFVAEGRSLYNLLRRPDDRYSLSAYWRSLRSWRYRCRRGAVIQFTALDVQLPGRFRTGLGRRWNLTLRRRSHRWLMDRCHRLFPRPDLIVLESTSCVLLLDALDAYYPGVALVYRPSDPLNQRHLDALDRMELIPAERRMTIRAAATLVRSEEDTRRYREDGYAFRPGPENPRVLPNGFDLAAFAKPQPRPPEYRAWARIACYVGGVSPDYRLLLRTARALPDLHLFVVCPQRMPAEVAREAGATPNFHYLPGVYPERVPSFFRHAGVVLIPYPELYPLMHGKVWQAMAAGKPIVAFNLPPALRAHGLVVARDEAEFVSETQAACARGEARYDGADLDARDWGHFQESFVQAIRPLLAVHRAGLEEGKRHDL